MKEIRAYPRAAHPKQFAIIVIACAASSALAQTEDPKMAARNALDTFFAAWNTGDIARVRETLHYPHITLFGARMIVANTATEFETDFARMRNDEGWASSALDTIDFGRTSPDKVDCVVTYSRKKADGTVYRTARTAYIVTKQNDTWRMQFRAPLDDEQVGSEATAAARAVIDAFFPAFNAADNERLQALSNYPHAFLLADGRVALSNRPDDLVTNFDTMRANEGWHSSRLDSAKIVHATPTQVHFDVVFSRLHEDGAAYRTVPARWIVTNSDGHWGLQFRSLMPPVTNAQP